MVDTTGTTETADTVGWSGEAGGAERRHGGIRLCTAGNGLGAVAGPLETADGAGGPGWAAGPVGAVRGVAGQPAKAASIAVQSCTRARSAVRTVSAQASHLAVSSPQRSISICIAIGVCCSPSTSMWRAR